MAKKPTITTIASGYYSRQALNNNFTALKDAFDNTVSRDGSTPNTMTADFDLNSNDILNVGNLNAAEVTVAGIPLASNVAAAAASATASALSATQAALYEGVWVDDVASLLVDTALTYSAGQPGTVVSGSYVHTRSEVFSYEVAASGATDQHVTTAGGVKLYVVLRDGAYNLTAFGAVGDGVTDDTAILQAAITLCATLGVQLRGGSRRFGVSGTILAESNTHIEDMQLVQLAPGVSGSVRTFRSDNKNNVTLKRFGVDRNGDGTNGGFAESTGVNGCLQDAFGIQLLGGVNHLFEDVYVTGGDTGTALAFMEMDASTDVIRPRAYDLFGINPIATDDNIQAIWFHMCTGLTVFNPEVRNIQMTYNVVGVPTTTTHNNRGIVFSGCEDMDVYAPKSFSLGQGLDLTGSLANINVRLHGGVMEACYSWGWKLSNSSYRCQINNALALDCSAAGFVHSSALDTGRVILPTDANILSGCISQNTASTDTGLLVSVSGFVVLDGTLANNVPIIFKDCIAVDNQVTKTMLHGFYADATTLAQAVDCFVSGAVTSQYQNIKGRSAFGRSRITSAHTVTTTLTKVPYNTLVSESDTGLFVSGTNRFVVKERGSYRIDFGLRFGGSTGTVTLRIAKNGTSFWRTISAQDSHVFSAISHNAEVGDYFEILAAADAGTLTVSLDVEFSYFDITRI
jgi:hypothetical protein